MSNINKTLAQSHFRQSAFAHATILGYTATQSTRDLLPALDLHPRYEDWMQLQHWECTAPQVVLLFETAPGPEAKKSFLLEFGPGLEHHFTYSHSEPSVRALEDVLGLLAQALAAHIKPEEQA